MAALPRMAEILFFAFWKSETFYTKQQNTPGDQTKQCDRAGQIKRIFIIADHIHRSSHDRQIRSQDRDSAKCCCEIIRQ